MDRDVRIFISSPSDVAAERERVDRVVAKLDAELHGDVRLITVRWEQTFYTATETFQAQIPRPSECELVICILWKRLGTELPPDRFHRQDGTPYASGTEFEFEDDALPLRQQRGAVRGSGSTPWMLTER